MTKLVESDAGRWVPAVHVVVAPAPLGRLVAGQAVELLADQGRRSGPRRAASSGLPGVHQAEGLDPIGVGPGRCRSASDRRGGCWAAPGRGTPRPGRSPGGRPRTRRPSSIRAETDRAVTATPKAWSEPIPAAIWTPVSLGEPHDPSFRWSATRNATPRRIDASSCSGGTGSGALGREVGRGGFGLGRRVVGPRDRRREQDQRGEDRSAARHRTPSARGLDLVAFGQAFEDLGPAAGGLADDDRAAGPSGQDDEVALVGVVGEDGPIRARSARRASPPGGRCRPCRAGRSRPPGRGRRRSWRRTGRAPGGRPGPTRPGAGNLRSGKPTGLAFPLGARLDGLEGPSPRPGRGGTPAGGRRRSGRLPWGLRTPPRVIRGETAAAVVHWPRAALPW